MTEPPLEGGGQKRLVVDPPRNCTVKPVGAAGTVAVVELAVVDAVPVPAALTAETRNVYVVECDSPVTVVDVVVEVPSVNVVHVEPLSDEYSTV